MLLDPKRKEFENPEVFIPSLLSGNEVVADIGCGPGFYCTVLELYSSKLYCVDVNDEALKLAKANSRKSSTTFLREPSDQTSIPANSVDVIVFANSFHDMNRESTYRETLRILKPSGRVIIVDWKRDAPFGPPLRLRMDPEHYLEIFKDFTLEKTFSPGPYHFGLVLRRK
ncbi:methyltransferase type 11 [Metallosphaera cuprina Ar-4]|uniref:Methyltransferase type 11 n=2 Tax=Sulfolobaceae TaxID=118883 RepID=F4G208_METCR|nr:methyltransferase type 11 [Metallosphaera cuprina Ar-4]